MTGKLLTKQHLEFLSLEGGAQARPSLFMSKCHIVGKLMPRLKRQLALFINRKQTLKIQTNSMVICSHTTHTDFLKQDYR